MKTAPTKAYEHIEKAIQETQKNGQLSKGQALELERLVFVLTQSEPFRTIYH